MHVVFRRCRHVVVNDVRDRVNINAARGDVGGDEHVRASLAEFAQCGLALGLRAVGMNPVHLMLACPENV